MLLLTFNRVLCDLPTFANGKQYLCTCDIQTFQKKEKKLVRVIGSFEKSRVREMGGETTVWSISEANSMATRFGSRYRVADTQQYGPLNRASEILAHNCQATWISCSLMLHYRVFFYPNSQTDCNFQRIPCNSNIIALKDVEREIPSLQLPYTKGFCSRLVQRKLNFDPLKLFRQKGLHLRPRGRLTFSRVSVQSLF